ncbi:MAG: phenylalanine--tRNA ligase subunit beta [Clostridiales bacterium]|nr:phenylalanine--tRNA ligase subunit beta [Clostridiales bacterium]
MHWLSEMVDVSDIDIKEYCDRMTDTGSKVEGYETLAEEISGVVIGKVVKTERHPDADRLHICQIDVGESEPVQIITSAQNVYEGAVVPVCRIGAELPGGIHIKPTKFRGLPSDGMMCSYGELGLTEHEMPEADPEGILLLNEVMEGPFPLGEDVCSFLGLREHVVEFEITPNRPDCLSVIGLAKETGASFARPVASHKPAVKGAGDDVKKYIDVSIESPLCARYSARVVKNVKIEPSPLWLRLRLHAAGVRPINNIVDITNYVMLEYGQPMHAFDYACLEGSKIVVKEAYKGQAFTSLDDVDHTLDEGMLTIQDSKKPVALAGVMGGANSEITEKTSLVVFESASFDAAAVRIASRALGMRTESSARFEKGLDSDLTREALERACELVELLEAGDVVDGCVDVYPVPKTPVRLPLEVEKINRFLGVSLTEADMRSILETLEFTFDGQEIIVPSFRDDVRCFNDIAEEIARIYGYNKIESTPFKGAVRPGIVPPRLQYKRRVSDQLIAMGYYECCTFSFISPKQYDRIGLAAQDERRNSVVISNPLGEDTSVMRTMLLPSMLECLARNNNNHGAPAKLFEIARVYQKSSTPEELPAEPLRIALGFYGSGDFYDMKGVIETLLRGAGITAVYTACATESAFHPGRCAEITDGEGRLLGRFGQIHPHIAEGYGLGADTYAAELDFEAIFEGADFEKRFAPLPKYPVLTRDFAFVCDESLEVGRIEAIIRQTGGKRVEEITLFDIYRGAQVGEGKKSVAYSITMRAPDRTLTDEEADKTAAKITKRLYEELGITLRA